MELDLRLAEKLDFDICFVDHRLPDQRALLVEHDQAFDSVKEGAPAGLRHEEHEMRVVAAHAGLG